MFRSNVTSCHNLTLICCYYTGNSSKKLPGEESWEPPGSHKVGKPTNKVQGHLKIPYSILTNQIFSVCAIWSDNVYVSSFSFICLSWLPCLLFSLSQPLFLCSSPPFFKCFLITLSNIHSSSPLCVLQELKNPKTGSGTDGGEETSNLILWPFTAVFGLLKFEFYIVIKKLSFIRLWASYVIIPHCFT